jgi:S1-C subfamily serine protease
LGRRIGTGTPPNLHAATMGDSSAIEPGDWVMAIGNLFGFGHRATVGMVSFPKHPVDVVLETNESQDFLDTAAHLVAWCGRAEGGRAE